MSVTVLPRLETFVGVPGPCQVPALRLRLIGQMEALAASGASVLPVGRKTRSLLAVVALAAPRAVLRSRLAELLWSRRPEMQARASLRQEIHRLGEALAPLGVEVLRVARDHLALRADLVWIDVAELLCAGESHPEPLTVLEGELLDGLDGVDPAFDAWLVQQRERIGDRAQSLAEAQLSEQAGPEDAIRAAGRLLAIDRAHEGAWRALMRAHAARGERGMAIRAYERCRIALSMALDARPSAETERLLAEIRDPAPPMISAVASGNGPCLGVLPPAAIGSAEPELAIGLADEITVALSRCRGISLVSSHALARHAAESRDEAAIRRCFSVDLLLDGTLQRSGDQIRLLLRLLDLRDGNRVVWTRRFDRRGKDLFGLQDAIGAETAAELDVAVLLLEAQRADRSGTGETSAAKLVLRAVPMIIRLERESFQVAGQLLNKAITHEPGHAAAYAWYALWHSFLCAQGWAEDLAAAAGRAMELAERAIRLDPGDARAHAIAGHVRAVMRRRPREAMLCFEQAATINPNLTMAWALSGLASAHVGETDEAERRLNHYKALWPFHPLAYYFDSGFVLLNLLRGDQTRAATLGRQLSEMHPGCCAALQPYLAALGHLGRAQEAAGVLRRVLAIDPRFTLRRFREASAFERVADREHVATGLRLAGVATGES